MSKVGKEVKGTKPNAVWKLKESSESSKENWLFNKYQDSQLKNSSQNRIEAKINSQDLKFETKDWINFVTQRFEGHYLC